MRLRIRRFNEEEQAHSSKVQAVKARLARG
jgi:hypothetical protein